MKHFPSIAVAALLAFGACSTNKETMKQAIGEYFEEHKEDRKKEVVEALQEFTGQGRRRERPPEPTLEERMKNRVKLDIGNAPVKGNKNAPITIVEFADFQCYYCGQVFPTVKGLLQDYSGKVRVAFIHLPLTQIHPNAMNAAKAAVAAGDQGKFWEMHDVLFENQKDLADATIEKLASGLGLNMEKFRASWKSAKVEEQIKKDMELAQANGVGGTPAFFVNGILLSGNQPKQAFAQLIDALLKEKS